MSRQFQAVLRKLVDDERYRERIKNDPRRIADDFQFTGPELRVCPETSGRIAEFSEHEPN